MYKYTLYLLPVAILPQGLRLVFRTLCSELLCSADGAGFRFFVANISGRASLAITYDCTTRFIPLPRICPEATWLDPNFTVPHMQGEAPSSTKKSVPPAFNNCGLYDVLYAPKWLAPQTNTKIIENTGRLSAVSRIHCCEDFAESLHE